MGRRSRNTGQTTQADGPGPVGDSRMVVAVVVLAGLSFAVALNLTPIYTNDFWLQLKVGEIIRTTGDIPRTILFACTEARDFEFLAHEWLPSVVSSVLYGAVGYRGMIVFKCALAVLIFGLTVLLSWRINRNPVVSVFIGCLTILAINFRTQMRPEIYAFVLALICLNLLRAFLDTGRRVWLVALLPVALVWANSHGSFLIGLSLPPLFLVGVFLEDGWRGRAAGRARKVYVPLVVAFALTSAVSIANPHGLKLFTYSLAHSQADWVRRNIVEFGATLDERVLALFYSKVFFAYLAVLVLSFLVARRRTTVVCLLLFLAFGSLSFSAIRYTAWLAVVGSYILAHNLGHLGRTRVSRTTFAIWLVLALAAGLGTVAEKGNVRGKPMGFRNMSPLSVGAIDFIRSADIHGHVFNSYNYGDQLVYHFFPRLRVTIDSRADAYGEEYYMKYRSMSGRSHKMLGPPGELIRFLDTYDIDTIVIRPYDYSNWQLKAYVPELEKRSWTLAFQDDTTLILRRSAEPAENRP